MTKKVEITDPLLLPAEVGQLFGVNPKTVTRWVGKKKIGAIKTLGGHHRFHPMEVKKLLERQYTGGNLNARLEELDRMIAEKNDDVLAAAVKANDLIDSILAQPQP